MHDSDQVFERLECLEERRRTEARVHGASPALVSGGLPATVDDLNFVRAVRIALGAPKRGRPCKYDWLHWLDGGVWELTRGVDFMVTRDQFRNVAIAAARSRSGKVVTRAHPDDRSKLRIQFSRTDVAE